MKQTEGTTCYFTRDELRAIEQIADRMERPRSKVVQFAVRVFEHLWKENPSRALEIAQSTTAANKN